MVTDFVATYAKMIVNYPLDIEVSSTKIDDTFFEITIMANDNDVGKLIGKNGNMINSIKTLINGCKTKSGNSYKIRVITK
jgi:uncharacterized protein